MRKNKAIQLRYQPASTPTISITSSFDDLDYPISIFYFEISTPLSSSHYFMLQEFSVEPCDYLVHISIPEFKNDQFEPSAGNYYILSAFFKKDGS